MRRVLIRAARVALVAAIPVFIAALRDEASVGALLTALDRVWALAVASGAVAAAAKYLREKYRFTWLPV